MCMRGGSVRKYVGPRVHVKTVESREGVEECVMKLRLGKCGIEDVWCKRDCGWGKRSGIVVSGL